MQPAVFWAARAVSAELIERLAADLRASFPGALGLNRRGLQYMRAFAEAWPEEVQQAAAQLPWSHIMVLLDRLDDHTVREWYATRDAAEGWSRAVVETMVASWLHLRQGPAPSNFPATLPDADSDLVQEITRDLVSPHRYLRAGHGAATNHLNFATVQGVGLPHRRRSGRCCRLALSWWLERVSAQRRRCGAMRAVPERCRRGGRCGGGRCRRRRWARAGRGSAV